MILCTYISNDTCLPISRFFLKLAVNTHLNLAFDCYNWPGVNQDGPRYHNLSWLFLGLQGSRAKWATQPPLSS